MAFARIDECVVHYRHRPGTGARRGIVFLNSLGSDMRIWADVIAGLPDDVPLLTIDKRGHGLSQVAPARMETFAGDAARLIETTGLAGALVCGISIGGMIAQTLALSRPDLVGGLVLANTGARIGTREAWETRLDTLREAGLEGLADGVVERWFSAAFRAARPEIVAGWRTMLVRVPAEGYAVACAALRDADLRERVGAIDRPTLCLAGEEDAATPPDLLADLADRIPGAERATIGGAGHLPCLEVPDAFRDHLTAFHGRL